LFLLANLQLFDCSGPSRSAVGPRVLRGGSRIGAARANIAVPNNTTNNNVNSSNNNNNNNKLLNNVTGGSSKRGPQRTGSFGRKGTATSSTASSSSSPTAAAAATTVKPERKAMSLATGGEPTTASVVAQLADRLKQQQGGQHAYGNAAIGAVAGGQRLAASFADHAEPRPRPPPSGA
jgi:hypothetical protein